jgi:hypothetical protein
MEWKQAMLIGRSLRIASWLSPARYWQDNRVHVGISGCWALYWCLATVTALSWLVDSALHADRQWSVTYRQAVECVAYVTEEEDG